MLRTIRNRISGVEDYLGKGRGVIIVCVEPDQTQEEALEQYYQSRPQDKEPPGIIFIRRTIGPKAMRERS